MKNLLVIMAHPDDDILGCGATICKRVEAGINVKVVFVAEGTTCRPEAAHPDLREHEILLRNNAGRSAPSSSPPSLVAPPNVCRYPQFVG